MNEKKIHFPFSKILNTEVICCQSTFNKPRPQNITFKIIKAQWSKLSAMKAGREKKLYYHLYNPKESTHNCFVLHHRPLCCQALFPTSCNEHINDVEAQTKLVIEAALKDIQIPPCHMFLPIQGQKKYNQASSPLHNRCFFLCCNLSASKE